MDKLIAAMNADRAEAIAAKLAAVVHKPKPEPIDNTELVRRFRDEGGQIVHLRPMNMGDEKPSRGMTVAYKSKGTRVEFATSLQHRADPFVKKIGTRTAIAHFDDGKTVTIPMRKTDYPAEALRNGLGWFT